MKIGLINAIPLNSIPPSHRYSQTLSLPLGLLYVATYLQQQVPDLRVFLKDKVHDLLDEGVDLLGIYSVTQNFNYAIEIAALAKSRGVVTVVGGPHITALPHVLRPEFDFGVVGEGEETFVELVRRLISGFSLKDEKWRNIPGITHHDRHGSTFFAGRRHDKKNVDDYPIPKRERWAKRLGVAHMITSRGCPYACSFCSEPVLWDAYRVHSPRRVVDEMRDIMAKFDIPHIMIFDDIFTISTHRIRSVVELMEMENIPEKMAFSCWGRTHLINEEMVSLLKRMNLVYIAFGIESASQKILSQLKKGATVEAHQRAIDLCHTAGIKIGCSFIVASPGETVEDLQKTYDFIEKNYDKISGIELNPAVPLPGTPLWQNALAKGLVAEDMDWDRLTDWSVFESFDLKHYVVTNENFFDPAYQKMFRTMYELYREVVDKGELAEHTLDYLNPTMEPAQFL